MSKDIQLKIPNEHAIGVALALESYAYDLALRVNENSKMRSQHGLGPASIPASEQAWAKRMQWMRKEAKRIRKEHKVTVT